MRLPDRFDLWVRKAQNCPDPDRQIDLLLGSLIALSEWHFYHQSKDANPRPMILPIDDEPFVLIFSSTTQAEDLTEELNLRQPGEPLPLLSLSPLQALPWVLGQPGLAGMIVNPGDYGFVLTKEQMTPFYQEWLDRGGQERIGFWIPNLTDEEEDFWQEHGL